MKKRPPNNLRSPLEPAALKSRLRFDYKVCQSMFGSVFSGKAYRTISDLRSDRNPIMSLNEADQALKYRIDFHVKTLIGKGQFTTLTTIGLDLEATNYPYEEPFSWVISRPIPYSPHFKKSGEICTGSIWEMANGRMLLGGLLVHIAMILNWDTNTFWTHETDKKNNIYEGWNPQAAKYYYNLYNKEPITKNFPYPVLPDYIHGGKETEAPKNQSRFSGSPSPLSAVEATRQTPVFRSGNSNQETSDSRTRFRPQTLDNVPPSKQFRRLEN